MPRFALRFVLRFVIRLLCWCFVFALLSLCSRIALALLFASLFALLFDLLFALLSLCVCFAFAWLLLCSRIALAFGFWFSLKVLAFAFSYLFWPQLPKITPKSLKFLAEKLPKLIPNPPQIKGKSWKSLSRTLRKPPWRKHCEQTPPGDAPDPPKSPKSLPKASQNCSKVDAKSHRKPTQIFTVYRDPFSIDFGSILARFSTILASIFA